eukprot:5874114-Lingulodinium_polyedra.AAC.1
MWRVPHAAALLRLRSSRSTALMKGAPPWPTAPLGPELSLPRAGTSGPGWCLHAAAGRAGPPNRNGTPRTS